MYIIFVYLLGVGLPIITIHNCPIKLRALTPPKLQQQGLLLLSDLAESWSEPKAGRRQPRG